MKRMMTITGAGLGVLILTALTGCSASQPSLPVSISAGNAIEVLWVDGHRVDDNLIVHGVMKRKSPGSTPLQGHVEVTVATLDDEILYQVCTPDSYLPPNLPGKGVKFERFRLELENVSAEDTKIMVSPHEGNHDENA